MDMYDDYIGALISRAQRGALSEIDAGILRSHGSYGQVLELQAERRRDALAGQAALDEANNRILELQDKNKKYKDAFDEIDNDYAL